MQIRGRFISVAGILLMAGSLAGAGEVRFASKPTAKRKNGKVTISFAASRETDVAVYVENAKGKVVRHLVAGVLGKSPPPPLKPGLSQSLTWDGKDDKGEAAKDGPHKVRVRLGMKPEFDGFLLENPASTGAISSLAVGPGGSLYAFHRDAVWAHWGSGKIKVLNRDATHQRVIMPFSASIAPEKIKPLGAFQTKAGDLVPRVHDLLRLNFYCGYREPFWRSPAQCPVVDSRGRVYWMVMGPAIAGLDADGGVPYDKLTGPKLLPEIKGLTMANRWFYSYSRPCLALSSDEKFIYFAGLTTGNPKKKDQPIKGVPCVFRVSVKSRGPAEVFLGKLGTPGKEKQLLSGPRGLVVAKGLVYVADHDADRIVVFGEKDRKLAGEIKVKAPDSLGVDPATGAVYVCSVANKKVPELIKFENWETGKELLRMLLPAYKYANASRIPHRIAVDASAKPVRIWVPSVPYSKYQLLCIEDAGDKFVSRNDPRSKTPHAEGPRDLFYDRVRGELYVKSHVQKWYRIDEKTGKITFQFRPRDISRRPEFGTQLVAGADGKLYNYSWSGKEAGLRLYGRDGKPTNWPGRKSNHIPLPGVMNYMQRTLIVRGKELFIIPPGNWRTASGGGGVKDGTTSLNVYGMDGKVKRTLIWQCFKGAIPRMDLKGNIYLAETIRPPDRSFPAFFDGKIKPPPPQTGNNNDSFYYSYMYGSIVKFPPSGGAIWLEKKVGPYVEGKPPAELLAKPKVKVRFHRGYRSQDVAEMQGALWYRFGFAPYTATHNSCYRTCMCEGGGFDVDPFGRVFYPNLGQFRVEVLDTNGNPITKFGKYGNQDDGQLRSADLGVRNDTAVPKKPVAGSPQSAVRNPHSAVPLAWPITVAVSDTHAYVADTLSRRVVKVKLGCAAEETCSLP
jgi:hypothetical protein